MKRLSFAIGLTLAACFWSPDCCAGERFATLAVEVLGIPESAWPAEAGIAEPDWRWTFRNWQAYADGGPSSEMHLSQVGYIGEIILHRPSIAQFKQAELSIRNTGEGDVAGRLIIPKNDYQGAIRLDFTIPAARFSSAPAERQKFLKAQYTAYDSLHRRGLPGGAWFRHQAQAARLALGDAIDTASLQLTARNNPVRISTVQDTYNLLTGGRALSENLQLDRFLRVGELSSEAGLPIDGMEGIKIEPIDWKPLIAGKSPERDPLALLIPADRHALFFPSFEAMTRLMDESERSGTPIFGLFDTPSQDAMSRARYEKQLCLASHELARKLGPSLVSSAAFTGSDPYLRVGSDVAVLFESPSPVALLGAIEMQRGASVAGVADLDLGKAEASFGSYSYIVSPDRSISSYCAMMGNVVVVANSRTLLDVIGETYKGTRPNLASTDEYTFFRDRYKRGDADETAFLMISDAAIRRWCGPRWRIGASRRTRAAAELTDLQATHLRRLVAQPPAQPIAVFCADAGLGRVTLTAAGVRSSTYGDLRFMTPILEMEMQTASPEEAWAYTQYRESYQRQWRQFFDPIRLRLSVADQKIGADLTVTPLIVESAYQPILSIVQGSRLTAAAGDKHPETMLHFEMAINPESPLIQQAEGGLQAITLNTHGLPRIETHPLGWLGKWICFFADEDPIWEESSKAPQGGASRGRFLEENYFRVPAVLEIGVGDPFKLAGFLATARLYFDQAAPGMTVWETRKEGELPYVRVARSEAMRQNETGKTKEEMVVFYAALPDRLAISFHEGTIKGVLRRAAGRQDKSKPGGTEAAESLGDNIALEAKTGALDFAEMFMGGSTAATMQHRAWDNIPILNEWKKQFDAKNPVAFHEAYWGLRLLCPGGGQYVWDEEFRTMSSTVFGSPARPAENLQFRDILKGFEAGSFGLTFENQGLRVRARLTRGAAKP